MSQQFDPSRRSHVSRSISVRATVPDTVAAWQRFLPEMDAVQQLGQFGSAQMLTESRAQRIDLFADPETSISTGGGVEFRPAPQGRMTEVRIVLARGELAESDESKWADSDTAADLTRDLFHFKQFAELGRLPTTDGQPTGAAARPTFVEIGS